MTIKNAHYMWAFFIVVITLTSIGYMDGNTQTGKWAIIGVIVLHILFSDGFAFNKYRGIFTVLAILFFYSITISLFKARSALIALQLISAFYVFCTLYDIKRRSALTRLTKIATDNKNTHYSFFVACMVLVLAGIQSMSLLISYIELPIRVTGLFLDYSQASFFIVLCFGIAYPSLRANGLTVLTTVFLFVGVFTTFSRTTNFLVVVLFAFLSIAEFRKGNLKRLAIVIISVIAALSLVYLYPTLIDAETVNRHGLSDIGSMNSRVYYWEFAIDAIKENPIWGYGLGNYEYLGVKDKMPYELITFAHNDYLQVWVALGIFWLGAFVLSLAYLLLKYFPIYIFESRPFDFHQYCSWVLLLCCSLYMLINFIIFAMPFQILIAIILTYLVNHEQTEKA